MVPEMKKFLTDDNRKKNVGYALITIGLLIVEVLIALFVHDEFIRPYIGDVLVTVLICTFLRIFIPESVKLLPLYVFIFAAGVEILQYFRVVEVLGLAENRFFSILIGSIFDVKDIVCYGVGCVVFFLGDKFLKHV